MDHELLESSLLHHGTYLLDQLHREQQVSIDDDLTQWLRSHLPHTVPPKWVLSVLFCLTFSCIYVYKLICEVMLIYSVQTIPLFPRGPWFPLFNNISYLVLAVVQRLNSFNSTMYLILHWQFDYCHCSCVYMLLLLMLIQRWVQPENSDICCSQGWFAVLQTGHVV